MCFETCASISRAEGAAKRSFTQEWLLEQPRQKEWQSKDDKTERKNESGVVGARRGSAKVR